MKNFATNLQRGNLTPKERYLMLIQNDVHRAKTGKDVLTEADKNALENWQAKNNTESHEWNRLNEGWKYSGRMGIEAEIVLLEAQSGHFRKTTMMFALLSYPHQRQMKKCIESLERIKKVSVKGAMEIAGKQRAVKLKDGMDFDYAVYRLAFENLTAEDKKSFNELYAEVEVDHQYLDQEEIIANLFDGQDKLTPEAKEKLATLVVERCYNKFAKEYQIFHYFACIPLAEIARHFLIGKGITVKGKSLAKNQESDDEDDVTFDEIKDAVEVYAKDHRITIEAMLKNACLDWLDGDLLEQYTPLAVSNGKELLERWLREKILARTTLNKLVSAGTLTTRERTEHETMQEKLYSKGLCDSELENARRALEISGMEIPEKGELDEKVAFETFEGVVITGESLYAFASDYEFVKEFKKRIDEYEPNLGLVYADDDPEQKGNHLDQELLICGLTDKGEPNFFSVYGMSMALVSGISEGEMMFKEIKQGDETFLEFKNPRYEEVFVNERQTVIDGYAKLLAFDALFTKLSAIYEVDIDDRIKIMLARLKECIDQHNSALRRALGRTLPDDDDKNDKKLKRNIFISKVPLQVKKDLFIDIGKIVPDPAVTEEHGEKLKDIFGDEFTMP